MVVVRNDTIKDEYHYSFTCITFMLMYTFHILVWSEDDAPMKSAFALVGMMSLVVFMIIMVITRGKKENQSFLWTLACVAEINGVLCTAFLDLFNVYMYGSELEY